jgi:hypothetical protein
VGKSPVLTLLNTLLVATLLALAVWGLWPSRRAPRAPAEPPAGPAAGPAPALPLGGPAGAALGPASPGGAESGAVLQGPAGVPVLPDSVITKVPSRPGQLEHLRERGALPRP